MADEASKQRKRQRRQRRQQLERRLKRSASERAEGQASSTDAKEQPRRKIEEKDITGLKYFEKLNPLLKRLHEDGCERDTANNRNLHFDQYCMLILLYLSNPIVTSLRGIQQASELAKVQRKLGCPPLAGFPVGSDRCLRCPAAARDHPRAGARPAACFTRFPPEGHPVASCWSMGRSSRHFRS